MYTTPAKLLTLWGAVALAELGGQALDDVVIPDCLKALINEASTASYSAEVISDAQAALDAINQAISDAGAYIDTYLGKHHSLPLDQTTIDESVLPSKAASVVRHMLMVHGADEQTDKNNKDATAWLRDVSRGVASISAADAAQDGKTALGFSFESGAEKRDWSGF